MVAVLKSFTSYKYEVVVHTYLVGDMHVLIDDKIEDKDFGNFCQTCLLLLPIVSLHGMQPKTALGETNSRPDNCEYHDSKNSLTIEI